MRRFLKHQLVYWAPVYAWAGLIAYFSLSPLPSSQILISQVKAHPPIPAYYQHLVSYGLLTILLWRALENARIKNTQLTSVFLAVAYGALNEACQLFVAGRSSSFFDAFSNLIGSLLVQPVIFGYKAKIRKKD